MYTIKSLIDGKTYVAKQLQGLKISNDEDNIAAAEKELNALRSYHHPLILKLIDLVKDSQGFVCIILKKCEQSLYDSMNKEPQMNEDKILRIITMLGLSLSYIHQ